MKTLIVTLVLTFVLFPLAALLFNYSRKRKKKKTGHELTGMCHKSGEASCGCASAARNCADDF